MNDDIIEPIQPVEITPAPRVERTRPAPRSQPADPIDAITAHPASSAPESSGRPFVEQTAPGESAVVGRADILAHPSDPTLTGEIHDSATHGNRMAEAIEDAGTEFPLDARARILGGSQAVAAAHQGEPADAEPIVPDTDGSDPLAPVRPVDRERIRPIDVQHHDLEETES